MKHLDLIKQEKLNKGDYYLELEFYSFYPKFELKKIRFKVLDKYKHAFLSFEDIELENYDEFMKSLFSWCVVKDCQYGSGKGHPDFEIECNNETFYIEYKSIDDDIHKSQIDWVYKTKKKVYFLFVSNVHRYSPPSKNIYPLEPRNYPDLEEEI